MRRSVMPTVIFHLKMGELSATFASDFGVFYDPEDHAIIEVLSENFGGYDWSGFVFWKDQAKATIRLINPVMDREVGLITIRSNQPGQVTDMTNVISMKDWKRPDADH